MSESFVASPIKREKIKREAKVKKLQQMRAALTFMNKNEVRRFRLPYHEALLLELQEQEFFSSGEYLRQLLQYQEDLRSRHEPDSVIFSRPRLADDREQLDTLCAGFIRAETAYNMGDFAKECDELLGLGIKFGFGSEDWWWLGEQLLIQAVGTAESFRKDGGKREAISRYIYGKFILENLLDYPAAMEELTTARQISSGKLWSAKGELGVKQESVFAESCKLIYKALLGEAEQIIQEDPLKAARLCTIARKRAADACDHKGEADVVMLQGMCEMAAGEASTAVVSFTKALTLHNKAGRVGETCEARIHLALAYLKIGNLQQTLKHLEALLEYAIKHNLPYYVAQAHRFLGEYYLNQGKPEMATPLLTKSLDLFVDISNRELARNLAAVSAGQELIKKYTELILNCGRGGTEKNHYLMALIRWKDCREMFWTDEREEAEATSADFEVMDIVWDKPQWQMIGLIEEYKNDILESIYSNKE